METEECTARSQHYYLSLCLIFLIAILGGVACTRGPLHITTSPRNEISGVDSFSLIPPSLSDVPVEVESEELFEHRVVRAIEHEMKVRGYIQTMDGYGDLRIRFYASDKGPLLLPASTSPSLKPGSFVLDIYSEDDGSLLWRGTANGSLREFSSIEQRQRDIGMIIWEILRDLPHAPLS